MTQQNEAIRLAVAALAKAESIGVPENIKLAEYIDRLECRILAIEEPCS